MAGEGTSGCAGGLGFRVSLMRTAASRPEANVTAATSQIAIATLPSSDAVVKACFVR